MITQQDHDELLVYLEQYIEQMNKKAVFLCKKGEQLIDVFMRVPHFKMYNDTFSELLTIDALAAGI